MKRDIRHCRQDIADLNAVMATIRVEGRGLMESGDTKSPKLIELLATLDAHSKTAAELATEFAHFEKLQDEERRAPTTGGAAAAGLVAPGRQWAQLFGAQTLTAGGWNNREEFFATLHHGLADPRLAFAPSSGLQAIATGGVPSDGGVLVPTQYTAELMDASLEDEIVRPLASVWPMTSSSRHVPGVDGSNHTSVLFGGFAGGWFAEGAELTAENMKLRMIELVARKLGILSEVSNELLRDGLGYDGQLSKAIIAAIGWFLDYGFLNGNGASQPLGVINAGCTITITKETNQAAGTINYTNLLKMFARMPAGLVKNAVWVANQSAIPQLGALSIAVGTGGSHIPVMSESNGDFKILTRPVRFTEKVPTLGTKGDIGFFAFSEYAVGLRQDMSLDKSAHVGFTRDTSHYRGLLRADGMPKWDKAFTPKNGDPLSPFIVLETRS